VDPIVEESDGQAYWFCSAACRDAFHAGDRVATVFQGFRRCRTGVRMIDEQLPEGFPRNAFVFVESAPGASEEALLAELVWNRLRKGEPVIVVAYQEPPASMVDQLASMDMNVIPYLERDRLHVVDCFTYRVRAFKRLFEGLDGWNEFLYSVIDGAATRVQNPSDLTAIHAGITNAAERMGMSDRGMVVVDSLDELGTLAQPVNTYAFIKDVRADLCKARFVPVFAGASATDDPTGFPNTLHYLVDGIVELSLEADVNGYGFAKFLRVRKMRGVPTAPRWIPYGYRAGTGLVAVDGVPPSPPPSPPSPTETESGS
jgi:KaiC/GvpD/RAD55 family RecA-like ATPase